jgi:serine/threonine protein kinase
MDPARWRKVSDLMERAQPLTRRSRRDLLELECSGDPELLAEVESLLAADASATGFLSQKIGASAAQRIAPLQHVSLEGREIAGFRILRIVGRGGMGVVYEAEQRAPRRRVALKLLEHGIGSSDRRGFRSEAEVLARLTHENIARVHAAGTEDIEFAPGETRSVAWIAMEYVEDARNFVAACADLPLARKLELAAQVCDAVHHGHERGVIHRDLKPSNVLVGLEGQPKVIDFGVARAVGATESMHSRQGDLIGTLQYMSPEQVEGRVADIDVRTDVYALGLLVYEVCVGRRPLPVADMTLPQAARVIAEDAPPDPAVLAPGFPRELGWVLLKALEKDKALRYAGADDLGGDLRRFLGGEALVAAPPNWTYRLRKQVRKHRAAFVAGAAVLLALLLGFVGTTTGLLRAQAAERDALRAAADSRRAEGIALDAEAVAERRLLEVEEAREEAEWRNYLAGISAADGALATRHAKAAIEHLDQLPPGTRGWEWHMLRNLADSSSRSFPHGAASLISATADRHARLLAVLSADRLLRVMNGRGEELDCFDLDAQAWRVSFSDDGRWLAFGDVTGRLRVRSLDGVVRSVSLTPAGVARSVTDLCWLDEDRVYALVQDEGLFLVDARTMATRLVRSFPPGVFVASPAVSPDRGLLAYGAGDGAWLQSTQGGDAQRIFTCGLDWARKGVAALEFSADGERLVVSTYVDGAWVVDLATLESARIELPDRREVLRIQRHPDPRLVVMSGYTPSPMLVSLESMRVLDGVDGARRPVVGVAYSDSGLWTFADDGVARLYDWSEAGARRAVRATLGITKMDSSRHGPLVATTPTVAQGGFELHDLQRMTTVWTQHGFAHEVRFVADGEHLLVRTDKGFESLSLAGPERVADFAPAAGVDCWSMHPTRPLVFVAGMRRARFAGVGPEVSTPVGAMHALPGGELVREFALPFQPQSCDWTVDGRALALAGSGKAVLLDAEDGDELHATRELDKHDYGRLSTQHALACAQDGIYISSQTDSGTVVRRFDQQLAAPGPRMALQGHTSRICPLPGAGRVLLCGNDDLFRLYDPLNGRQILGLRGQTNWVSSATWNEAAQAACTIDDRFSLVAWSAAPAAERAASRAAWTKRLAAMRATHGALLDPGLSSSDFRTALAQRSLASPEDRLALFVLRMEARSSLR